MGMSLMDWLEQHARNQVTKENFGELIHSDDPEDVEKALKALEDNHGYDNLPD